MHFWKMWAEQIRKAFMYIETLHKAHVVVLKAFIEFNWYRSARKTQDITGGIKLHHVSENRSKLFRSVFYCPQKRETKLSYGQVSENCRIKLIRAAPRPRKRSETEILQAESRKILQC